MRVLEARRLDVDPTEFRYRAVDPATCKVVVKDPTLVKSGKEIMMIYDRLPAEEVADLRKALVSVKYLGGARTLGIKQTSRTFGYMPRNAIRIDSCRITQMSTEYPSEHEIVCAFAPRMDEIYRRYVPKIYDFHRATVGEKIKPDWKLQDSVFTSGIINKNCAMNYHTDTGNFAKCWSAMIVLKDGVEGGELCLPEFNMRVACDDAALVLFNGQDYVHGVSPIKLLREDGYRISVVFYSLQQLWQCLPPKEEFRRLLNKRTERERNRAAKEKEKQGK